MKKSNPLFVDSTKMRGDNIITLIELGGLKNHFNASAYVRLMSPGDSVGKVFHLSNEGEDIWRTQVYLRHQEEISYQFFVARDGSVLASSEMKTVSAGHALVEKWKPSENVGEFQTVQGLESPVETTSSVEQESTEILCESV